MISPRIGIPALLVSLVLSHLGPLRADTVGAGDAAPSVAREIEGWIGGPGDDDPAEALEGHLVVLEFWATWCAPCVEQFPHLNELAHALHDAPVRFVSVTDETRARVEGFLEKRPLETWVALDTDASLLRAFGVTGIPRTVVIDRDGRVAAMTEPQYLTEEAIRGLLAGEPVSFPDRYARSHAASREEDDRRSEALFALVIEPSSRQGRSTSAVRGRFEARGHTLRDLLASAFGVRPDRIRGNGAALDEGRFDARLVLPPSRPPAVQSELLQAALTTTFGLEVERRPVEVDAWVLRRAPGEEVRLEPGDPTGDGHASDSGGTIVAVNWNVRGLAPALGEKLEGIVVDETELEGVYDWHIRFDAKEPASLVAAVREQLGLELVRARRSVEHLYVRRAGEPASPRREG